MMTPDTFLVPLAVSGLVEQTFNGLTIGIVYVLIAAGLSIIFGVMDVINFSHGELYALGAYFTVALVGALGASTGFWVGLVVAPLVVAVLGMAMERFTLRPLYGRNPLYHILLTFGFVLIIKDLIELVWDSGPKLLSVPATLEGTISLFGISYPVYNAFMIAFGGLLALGSWLVLNRTRFGLVVRAGALDRDMVRNLGINIDRYYTVVFGFGAALAGIAGVVLGTYQGVSPTMGDMVIIPAFVIVVIGGLGSFRGAVVGGLAVGLVQNFGRVYLPELEGLMIYLLMILVLLAKPRGLFGTEEEGHGEENELRFESGRSVLNSRQRFYAGAGVIAILAVLPFGVDVLYSGYVMTLLATIFVWALFALSLDFVMGYTGLVSLGHAMFFGLGAYTAMLTMVYLTPSVIVATALAIVVTVVVAWVVGYLSIRLTGVYFAMITLAFAQLFYSVVFKLEWAGGSDGLFGVTPFYGIAGIGLELEGFTLRAGPFALDGEVVFYYLLIATVVGSYLLARQLMRAPFGSVLRSIRESEERSAFIGYDVTRHKRRAFVLSGALAGLSGALLAFHQGQAAPSYLHWLRSGEVIVMTVLGGMGTLFGPMVGAGVYIGFKDLISSYLAQWQLVLGIIFVLFVIFLPRGLVSVPSMVADKLDSLDRLPTGSFELDTHKEKGD
ncbi:MAG: branched-chain amino acid transport system permease protein [Haloarculaceae archaeon]|jgi:branched-chain amino acid transport system permease protein